jgi:hypothetical protein
MGLTLSATKLITFTVRSFTTSRPTAMVIFFFEELVYFFPAFRTKLITHIAHPRIELGKPYL